MAINWVEFTPAVKDKYKDIVDEEDGIFKFQQLNKDNLNWIDSANTSTTSYATFTEEVNALELSINLFENLLMFEDLRYESEGIDDFPIDMPREYFRFPALNNPRDTFSYKELSSDEANIINSIIMSSRSRMNIRNDENIAREYIVKLEFLSLFSIFEAYLENYYSEWLMKKSQKSEEDALRDAGNLIRNKSLDEALKTIINCINPEIVKLLFGLKGDMFDFIYLAYIVRNIHTHRLGKITDRFIELGQRKNIVKPHIQRDDDGKIIKQYLYVDCILGEHKIIEKDKYFSIKLIASLFRSYANEIAFILDKEFA